MVPAMITVNCSGTFPFLVLLEYRSLLGRPEQQMSLQSEGGLSLASLFCLVCVSQGSLCPRLSRD